MDKKKLKLSYEEFEKLFSESRIEFPNIYTILEKMDFENISKDKQKDFNLIQKFYDTLLDIIEKNKL